MTLFDAEVDMVRFKARARGGVDVVTSFDIVLCVLFGRCCYVV